MGTPSCNCCGQRSNNKPGLEVHLGTGSVSSKTEAMFFPSQNSDPLVLTTKTADFEVFPG
jgi:hypothetical protein